MKCSPSVLEFGHLYDGVEVSTWADYSTNDNVNSKAELYEDSCIQHARDQFVLPRYRVGSVIVRVSGRTQIDGEQ